MTAPSNGARDGEVVVRACVCACVMVVMVVVVVTNKVVEGVTSQLPPDKG